jgi:hypothetical protein
MAKNKKNKKIFLWLLILVILVLTSVGSYFVFSFIKNTKNETDASEQVEQSDDLVKNEDIAEKVVEEKKVIQYEGEDANDYESLTGVVTYASVNDDKLMIRVSIDQYLTNGICELNLLNDGATIYSSIANIIGIVSNSTCEGFDIPMTELVGGAMEININLNDGERSGLIREEVNI